MKKIKLFFSDKCPHCPPIISKLDELKIDYEKVNITNSMQELKEFLKLRDTEKFFEQIKAEGRVGVPTLLVEDKLCDPYEMDLESLKK